MNKERLLKIADKVNKQGAMSDVLKDEYFKLVDAVEKYNVKKLFKLDYVGSDIQNVFRALDEAVVAVDKGKFKTALKDANKLGKELEPLISQVSSIKGLFETIKKFK